jgi:hypothetical protein
MRRCSFATVADRARGIDPRAQGRFRDNPSIPNRGEKIVLGNDALSAPDGVFEEVENLWLERNQRPRRRCSRRAVSNEKSSKE